MARGRTTIRDLSVGVVVTVAAVIFAVGIFSIGSEQRLWTRKATYRLLLPSTEGLQTGAPVRLAGVQVGTVTRIVLPTDPNRRDIEVEFSVDRAVTTRVRADSTATLKVLSLLAGDRFVELYPGSATEPELPEGSVVPVPAEVSLEELQAIGATIADDLSGITGSFRILLEQLQDESTLMGQALFDPSFGREALSEMRASIDATRAILEDVQAGRGLAGRMLMDEKFAQSTMSRIEGSLTRMESLLARLDQEGNALALALDPEGPLTESLENMKVSSENLLEVSGSLREGEGVAGRLLMDEAYAGEVLGDLQAAARALREVAEKLNQGEGTAGALLNDPAIYQDLQDVLRGVKKSKLVSWMIRHYRKKGEKARLKEEEKMREAVEEEMGEGV